MIVVDFVWFICECVIYLRCLRKLDSDFLLIYWLFFVIDRKSRRKGGINVDNGFDFVVCIIVFRDGGVEDIIKF